MRDASVVRAADAITALAVASAVLMLGLARPPLAFAIAYGAIAALALCVRPALSKFDFTE